MTMLPVRCRSFNSVAVTASKISTSLHHPPPPITVPTNYSHYIPLLSSCRDLKTLLCIHARLVVLGITHVNSVLTHLINTYSLFHKCDSARLIFDSVTNPGVVLYNSLIRAYGRSDQFGEALKFYHKMLERGMNPDNYTYTFVLKACGGKLDLEEGVKVHRDVIKRQLESDVFIATALVDMYCKMGELECAREVFDKMPKRDVVCWNAMIGGLSEDDANSQECLHFFLEMMHLSGVVPNSVTFLNLFPALCKLGDVRLCRSVHGFVIRRHFRSEVFNRLIDLYCKCGFVEDARHVFDGMRGRDHVSWGTMMAGYAHNAYFYEVLELFDIAKSKNMVMNKVFAVSSSLAASELRDLEKGREIHNRASEQGVDSDTMVATSLMTMYLKCGELEKAKQLFRGLEDKDLVAWSALIAAYVQSGYPEEAMSLFREMVHGNLKPSSVTLLSVLPAFVERSLRTIGKSVHCYAVKFGIDLELAVGNSLVSMYAKWGLFTQALTIFHKIPCRNVVSWNALINGYAQSGETYHALDMFYELLSSGMKPDSGTMLGVVPACALSHDLDQGTCVHGLIIKSGLSSDCHVKNALIDMYGKCGRLWLAEALFNETGFTKDEVSWSSIIASYVHNKHPTKAISAFCRMKSEGFQPSTVSIVSVLPALAELTAFEEGMMLHACTVHMGFQSNSLIGNSLIDMYAKCGRFDFSEKYFYEMENKDTVSWNTILSGYAVHGQATRAIELFLQMQNENVVVDSVSFLGVLSACRHGGLIEEGRKIFYSMRDNFDFEPKLEHYACMVDLLGRSGLFVEIMNLINKMPIEPDATVWGALLGACSMHSNVELAEEALKNLVKLEPGNPAHYINLSNIYAQTGRWDEAKSIRSKLTDVGLKKSPGQSWL